MQQRRQGLKMILDRPRVSIRIRVRALIRVSYYGSHTATDVVKHFRHKHAITGKQAYANYRVQIWLFNLA